MRTTFLVLLAACNVTVDLGTSSPTPALPEASIDVSCGVDCGVLVFDATESVGIGLDTEWLFSDGATATGVTTDRVLQTADEVVTVTVTVTDAYGQTDSQRVVVGGLIQDREAGEEPASRTMPDTSFVVQLENGDCGVAQAAITTAPPGDDGIGGCLFAGMQGKVWLGTMPSTGPNALQMINYDGQIGVDTLTITPNPSGGPVIAPYFTRRHIPGLHELPIPFEVLDPGVQPSLPPLATPGQFHLSMWHALQPGDDFATAWWIGAWVTNSSSMLVLETRHRSKLLQVSCPVGGLGPDKFPTLNITSESDTDTDGDGYGVVEDCDDLDAEINPGAQEQDGNGRDDDCDGVAW